METSRETPLGMVVIRSAAPDDAARLRALRLEALTDSPTAFSADYTATLAQGVEVWEARITGFARNDNGLQCVAAHQDRLVGMAGITRGERPKTRHSGTIWGVYITPEWRRQRLAEGMIDLCLEWAGAHELAIVKLAVVATNAAAIHCYNRCGFNVYGVEPKAIYYEGVYYDELLMARAIPAVRRA